MIKEELSKRFGEHRVLDFEVDPSLPFNVLQLNLELKRMPVTVLVTEGLRNKKMSVPKPGITEHVELFFCLPSYWEINDKENSNMQWPLIWLEKLGKHLLNNDTWYGPGHTFSNGNPPVAFSDTMKPNYLLLMDPIELEEHLAPVSSAEITVDFLAIIPIYEQELDIKNAKGYTKFLRKFRAKNGNEILDDFRQNIFESRWRIF
jgi:hypothetical protein